MVKPHVIRWGDCAFLIEGDESETAEDRLTDFAEQAEPESITKPASNPKTCQSDVLDARELNQLSEVLLSYFHI